MDEQQQGQSNGTVKADEGVWVLIRSAGRTSYARLKDHKKFSDQVRTNVYGAIKNNSALMADISLDYFSPIQRVPIPNEKGEMQQDPNNPGRPLMGVAREEIATNFEHTVLPCPIAFFHIGEIAFVDEMRGQDKQHALSLIHQTLEHIARRRMEAMGLGGPEQLQAALQAAAANGGPLPPGIKRMPDTPDGKPHFKVDLRGERG